MEKAKVGRPTLREKEKRKANLKVRLLDTEVEKLRKLHGFSKETSQSEMIRNILFGKPIAVKVENIEFKKLLSEVNGVRQELNYLSKSKKIVELKTEIGEVEKLYKSLYDDLVQLSVKNLFLKDLREMTEEDKKNYWY